MNDILFCVIPLGVLLETNALAHFPYSITDKDMQLLKNTANNYLRYQSKQSMPSHSKNNDFSFGLSMSTSKALSTHIFIGNRFYKIKSYTMVYPSQALENMINSFCNSFTGSYRNNNRIFALSHIFKEMEQNVIDAYENYNNGIISSQIKYTKFNIQSPIEEAMYDTYAPYGKNKVKKMAVGQFVLTYKRKSWEEIPDTRFY
jgi:hypothetical protein